MDQVVPCPSCGKWVQSVAVECRYCGKAIPSQAPAASTAPPGISSPASRAAAALPGSPPQDTSSPWRGTGQTRAHLAASIVFGVTFAALLVLIPLIETTNKPSKLAIGCFWMVAWFNGVSMIWLLIRSSVKDAIVSVKLQERGE